MTQPTDFSHVTTLDLFLALARTQRPDDIAPFAHLHVVVAEMALEMLGDNDPDRLILANAHLWEIVSAVYCKTEEDESFVGFDSSWVSEQASAAYALGGFHLYAFADKDSLPWRGLFSALMDLSAELGTPGHLYWPTILASWEQQAEEGRQAIDVEQVFVDANEGFVVPSMAENAVPGLLFAQANPNKQWDGLRGVFVDG
ncbi:MAG: hypothetical protein EBR81_15745, partial [Proteobacteria bacterium]|nr:hypothetical protein [Pseudomonadota bacterium]